MAWDLVFAPLAFWLFGLALYVLLETFGILLHGLMIAEITGNYARIAAAGDGTDQATGQPVMQELQQAISQTVPALPW